MKEDREMDVEMENIVEKRTCHSFHYHKRFCAFCVTANGSVSGSLKKKDGNEVNMFVILLF